jgi:hypothetical protein
MAATAKRLRLMAAKRPTKTTHRREIILIPRTRASASSVPLGEKTAIDVFQITNPEQQKQLIARRETIN